MAARRAVAGYAAAPLLLWERIDSAKALAESIRSHREKATHGMFGERDLGREASSASALLHICRKLTQAL